jgi:hypothetical protein
MPTALNGSEGASTTFSYLQEFEFFYLYRSDGISSFNQRPIEETKFSRIEAYTQFDVPME